MAGRGRSSGAEAEQEQADEAGLTSDRRPGGVDRREAEASCRRRYESGGRRSTVSRIKGRADQTLHWGRRRRGAARGGDDARSLHNELLGVRV
jgi:hypothetical protein